MYTARHPTPDTRHACTASGFTLMELLVVTAILGVVVAAIAGCLSAGIRVWESAQGFDAEEAEAMFALRAVQKDLMNALPFYGTPVEGTPQSMTVPAEVEVLSDAGVPERRIGAVSYFVDPRRHALFRRVWAFPDAEPVSMDGERIAADLKDVRFWYAAASGEPGEAVDWADRWQNPTNLPHRIRIELTFDLGDDTATYARTFLLPGARDEVVDE